MLHNVTGTILLRRFQKMRRTFPGGRNNLEIFIFNLNCVAGMPLRDIFMRLQKCSESFCVTGARLLKGLP